MAQIFDAPVIRGPQDYRAQSQFNTNLIMALTGGLNYINLQAGGVRTVSLANLAVTTAKIDNLAVTQAKIGNLAVGSAQIDDLAVTNAKIDNLSVTTGKIDNLAVTTAKIDNLAVTTGKIDNLAVTNAKIDSMEAGKITAGTIAATISIEGPTITGGTLRTAASGARLEVTSSGLVAWLDGSTKGVSIENDAFGQIKLNASNGFLTSFFGDLYLGTGYGANLNIWSDGDLEVAADASSGTLTLKDMDYTRTLAEIIEHTHAGVYSPVGHSHSVSTGGAHNHGITDGTVLMVNGGGTVTWVANAGHNNHSIS